MKGMSIKNSATTKVLEQSSIKKFITRSPLSEIQERAKQREIIQKHQERVKQTTPLGSTTKPKRKTPPSIEEDPSKRLHFEDTSSPVEPVQDSIIAEPTKMTDIKEQCTNSKQNNQHRSELEEHEERMLIKIKEMITPIELGMKSLHAEWNDHKEEIRRLQVDNQRLNQRLLHVENSNRDLLNRIQQLEDQQVENNIVFSGVQESAWESSVVCREKIVMILARLVKRERWEDQLKIAKNIPILEVKRIGRYSPLRTRPVSVKFSCRGDIDYILENRRSLGKGIFAEQEYGLETTKNRRLLRPILNAARRQEEYKGKCRMEGDSLIIHGKKYTKNNLKTLPDNISGFSVTSRCDGNILAFFGELNPFSNFHPSPFTYDGVQYHSAEQMIQYMKACFFEDEATAQHILQCDNALECKQIARNISGYKREEWMKAAKVMCENGIFKKFQQNEPLANLLMSTESQLLAEASKDTDWGIGMSLHDERCLIRSTWYSQGLLGSILEEVRSKLLNITGGNKSSQEEKMDETTSRDERMLTNTDSIT